MLDESSPLDFQQPRKLSLVSKKLGKLLVVLDSGSHLAVEERLRTRMYVCICICYTCIYVCMCIHIHVCVCVCVRDVCVYVCICIRYIRMYVCNVVYDMLKHAYVCMYAMRT